MWTERYVLRSFETCLVAHAGCPQMNLTHKSAQLIGQNVYEVHSDLLGPNIMGSTATAVEGEEEGETPWREISPQILPHHRTELRVSLEVPLFYSDFLFNVYA